MAGILRKSPRDYSPDVLLSTTKLPLMSHSSLLGYLSTYSSRIGHMFSVRSLQPKFSAPLTLLSCPLAPGHQFVFPFHWSLLILNLSPVAMVIIACEFTLPITEGFEGLPLLTVLGCDIVSNIWFVRTVRARLVSLGMTKVCRPPSRLRAWELMLSCPV